MTEAFFPNYFPPNLSQFEDMRMVRVEEKLNRIEDTLARIETILAQYEPSK